MRAAFGRSCGGKRTPLDPIVHQATRLRILAALMRNRALSFPRLREALDLTEGNLGSHLAKLEQAGYVEARGALSNLAFETRWRLTARGADAFRAYVQELRAILEAAGSVEEPALQS